MTGATGLLGNSVVRELLQRGQRVRVLVRPDRRSPTHSSAAHAEARRVELAGLNVEVFTGDINDTDLVRRAVEGCRAVVHSAALVHIGYQRLEEARHANVLGTANIAAACLQAGIRLVYVSTVDTLPAAISADQPLREDDPGLPKIACTYVISKREAEARVVEAVEQGLDAVIAHPGFMLAPYDWKPSSGAMFLAVNKAPVVVAPRGTASVCDARDVAAALVNSIELGAKGQHYILAGENLAYSDLCRRMVDVIGRPKRVFRMGPVIPAAARLADAWYRLTGVQEQLFNGAAIAMGGLHHAYDSTKAEQQLHYHRRPIDQTLRDAWQWLRDQRL